MQFPELRRVSGHNIRQTTRNLLGPARGDSKPWDTYLTGQVDPVVMPIDYIYARTTLKKEKEVVTVSSGVGQHLRHLAAFFCIMQVTALAPDWQGEGGG